MSSRETKGELRESSSAKQAESQQSSSDVERENESQVDDVRLSMKGALRESGRHTSFEVRLDPNSVSAEFEKERMMLEQLESVDFFIEQGFLDVAFNALERLDRVYPNHPLIQERLERMAQLELEMKTGTTQPSIIPIIPEPLSAPQSKEPDDLEPEDDISEKNDNSPDLELTFEIALITDEVPVITDETPVLSEEMIEQFQAEQTPDEDSLQSTSDPSDSLEETEIREESGTQAGSELFDSDKDSAVPAEGPEALEALIQELQEDVGEMVEPDFQIHFNIGQAYLELELVDDAIEEFQAAYRDIQAMSQDVLGHPVYFQCCIMLGQCFRIKEMLRPSYLWLKRALQVEGRTEAEYNEARYGMAWVHEELEEVNLALELYEQIAASMPDYLDTLDKIKELRSRQK
jgi:tetratricopeptide (TPR) repeat protein